MQWIQFLVLLHNFLLISGCKFEKSISREKTEYSDSVHLGYRQWNHNQCLEISRYTLFYCNGRFTMETCSSLLGITSELNNHLRDQTAGKTMSLLYNIYYLDFSIKN